MAKLKFDLRELAEEKKRNFEERLKFIDMYVEWLKRTPNAVWSLQQKKLIDRMPGTRRSVSRRGKRKPARK